jgi:hypothetical protein
MNTAVMGETQLGDLEPDASDEFVVPTTEELPLGTCIHGKYVIHGVLGHGGFAVVYDAEHLGLGRRVAIKVLHLHADTPLALLERFHREARISALVRHPNVLEVYDTGTLPDGSPFLVMERVSGETLSAAIARGPLPIAMVVELGSQLGRGLEAIGDAGVVHRDIKPDNIMLHLPRDAPPLVKLVDFGISKQIAIETASRLTCHGALVGTPQYMSPEQIRGEEVDVRSDIYAIGAVLYEALTGHAPHESASFSELVVAVLNNEIVPPHELRSNCPSELEQIVLQSLARARDRRFASPTELVGALERVAEQLGLPRGDEAFYAPDPAELMRRPIHVVARDTTTLVRRLWPLRLSGSRPLQLGLVAALIVGAQGVLVRSGDEEPRAATAAERAAGVARSSVVPALRDAAEPTATATPAIAQKPSALPLFEEPAQNSAGTEQDTAHVGRAEPATAPEALSKVDTSGNALPVTEELKREGKVAALPAVDTALRNKALVAGQRDQSAKATELPATDVAAEAAQDRSKRDAWERAMQTALAELVRGRLPAAQLRYREAVRLQPREATGFRGLGLVSARLGDVRTAREALTRYLELMPRASDAAAIQARLATLR